MTFVRFFTSLLLLSIGFVVQVKWGNGFGFEGAPLIVGSLAAMGAILEWPELLAAALLAVYAMHWDPAGIPLPLLVVIALPFAVLGTRFFRLRSGIKKFKSTRNDWPAAIGAASAVIILVFMSHAGAMNFIALGAGVVIAVAWSILTLRILEIYR